MADGDDDEKGSKMKDVVGVVFFCFLAVSSVGAREIYVDVNAADGGDGTALHPFSAIEEARDAVRRIRTGGVLGRYERVDVILAPGDYHLERTLEFAPCDSGANEDAPVVWRAGRPGTVRIIGGVRVPIGAFGPVSDEGVLRRIPERARSQVRVADISQFVQGKIPDLEVGYRGRPRGLFVCVNGAHAPLARWPNVGFVSFTKCVDSGKKIASCEGGGKFSPGAFVFENPRIKDWDISEGVWLHGYWTHDWHDYCARIASFGTENGTNDVVRLASGVPYGIMNDTWGRKDRRFYAFNLLEELDAPGECYLDRVHKLLYLMPPNGEFGRNDEVFLATFADCLVASRGGPIAHFRLQDLTFGYTYGDAVSLTGHDIQVRECRILCVGKTGLCLAGDCNLIRGCEVSQCGEIGIKFSGGNRQALVRAESIVEKCDIHDFGIYRRTYAAGLQVDGCGCLIRQNLIHEAPHCAVLYGGNEHVFEFNNVYRVLLETGDAGAYYTGRDWTTQGNVLRYNFTHDLGTEGADSSTMGFYFDDCDCGDEVYGNIFWKVACGVKHGGGREHPMRNNIFAECQIGIGMDARGKRWKQWNQPGGSWDLLGKAKKIGYTNEIWAARYPRLADIMNDEPQEPIYSPVEHNIFLDCTRSIVSLGWKDEMDNALKRLIFSNNLVINSRGTNDVEVAALDARIASGFKVFNGTKDAPDTFGFFNPRNGDFRFSPGSRILREMGGFSVIPLERIPKPKRYD